jgi:hypothetical protein
MSALSWKTTTQEQRFDARVRKSEDCWIYEGARTRFGHGSVQWNGKKTTAHRAMWMQTNGPIPEGLCVLHRCDNPPCVRPDHLFLGTKRDNTADMWSKGRQAGSPAENAVKTACPKHGTAFETKKWGRICRECRREIANRWARKHRERTAA